MSLYRCKVCGSPKVAKTTQAGGITFNFAKGLIGEAVLGLGGIFRNKFKSKKQKNKRTYVQMYCYIKI